MRRDLLVIALMVFLALVVVVLIFEEVLKNEGEAVNSSSEGDVLGVISNDDNINDSSSGDGIVVGGGSGEGSGGGGINNVVSGESIPDIAAEPCGYYFEGYGVCNGTCPDGVCVQDGGSCYCQNR